MPLRTKSRPYKTMTHPERSVGSGAQRERIKHHGRRIVLHINMCNNTHMATNLALDDKLIEEARRSGGHKTKKEAVTAALAEYVRRRKQLELLPDFGTFDFDPNYDYKAERRGKPR